MRALTLALALLPAIALAQTQPLPQPLRFDLRATPPASGWTTVAPDRAYADGFGYERPTTPGGPLLFSAAVPEGNYRVTVTLGDAGGASNTTVKAESRRLMLQDVATRRGRLEERSFIVNVRNATIPPPPLNAPGGAAVRLNDRETGSYSWDDKLTLEFVGPAPRVARIEIAPVTVPTAFLVGDSTVTDQRSESGASWGQMFTRFLDDGLAVANHAESGETMKSSLTGLRLDKVLSQIKPGDYLFIQFGHNDQKANWPQTYAEAATTYRSYLKVYADEAKRRGATPVFVTPPDRRNFEPDGTIRSTLADYVAAMKATGEAEKVAVIDLNAASRLIYQSLGPALAPRAFSNDGKDATHHNNYGAYLMARSVIEGVRAAGLPLAQHIQRNLPAFDPAKPPLPDALVIAPSMARTRLAPRGN